MRRPWIIAAVALCVTAAAQAQTFRAVWAAGPRDFWGAGSNGSVIHGVNGAWGTQPSGTTSELRSIWGAAANDVWIVGESGTILRWNGSSLNRMPSPVNADFIAVTGCAANDVWIIGQSEGDRQPPPVLRWNGTALVPQTLGVAFRPAGISGTCPNLAIAGTVFFDPRPTERRTAGVLARLQAGRWVIAGWNGQRVTDDQIGGTGWTGISANGGVMVLRGGDNNEVLLLSGRTGWTRLPAPPGDYEAIVVTGDGSPVLIMTDGFARLAQGQWRRVGGPIQQTTSRANEAEMQRIQRRMEALGQQIQRSGTPTPAQIQELSQLQMQLMAASTGQPQGATMEQVIQAQQTQSAAMMAQISQAQVLAFGNAPGAYAGRTGSDFYVASSSGSIYHVTGDESRLLYSAACAGNPSLCATAAPASAPAATPANKPLRARPAGAPRPAGRP